MKLVDFLVGKKTYLVAIVLAVLNLAVALNWATVEQLDQVNAVLVALGLGALRAGVAKS
jgi:uncharacterized membrane protein